MRSSTSPPPGRRSPRSWCACWCGTDGTVCARHRALTAQTGCTATASMSRGCDTTGAGWSERRRWLLCSLAHWVTASSPSRMRSAAPSDVGSSQRARMRSSVRLRGCGCRTLGAVATGRPTVFARDACLCDRRRLALPAPASPVVGKDVPPRAWLAARNEVPRLVECPGSQRENDALNWPHCDVLNWPHLSVRS